MRSAGAQFACLVPAAELTQTADITAGLSIDPESDIDRSRRRLMGCKKL
jgi:hypothetical protein